MINKDNIKIGDKVYKILTFGNYPYIDMQVVSYVVKYIGEDAFIPENFQTLADKYQIIKYNDCYSTLAEVERAIIESYKDAGSEINEIKLVPLSSNLNINSHWNVEYL